MGKYGVVAMAEIYLTKLLAARRHPGAGFPEQPFHLPGPSVLIGVDDELQFPQEMRAA